MRRQPATLLALLLAVAPDVACRRPAGASAADARELVIGVTLNPQRAGMESIDRGVELAVATLNAELERSPAPGRVARFALRRTPRHVTSAVQAAGLLRDDPAVVGIVGDAESGRTLDAISIIEDAAATARAPSSPSRRPPPARALRDAARGCSGSARATRSSSRTAARYAADSLGARRAAVIYRNDPVRPRLGRDLRRAFQERGGTLVLRDPYVAGVTEWAALAGYVGRLDADVLLFPGSAEDAAAAAPRAAAPAGVRIPVIGGDPSPGSRRCRSSRRAVPHRVPARNARGVRGPRVHRALHPALRHAPRPARRDGVRRGDRDRARRDGGRRRPRPRP
jgi:ABC-type branched-subunit amino acid transport system substrate-binding protein